MLGLIGCRGACRASGAQMQVFICMYQSSGVMLWSSELRVSGCWNALGENCTFLSRCYHARGSSPHRHHCWNVSLVTGRWQTAAAGLGTIGALSVCAAKCHQSRARGPMVLGISQTCTRSPSSAGNTLTGVRQGVSTGSRI